MSDVSAIKQVIRTKATRKGMHFYEYNTGSKRDARIGYITYVVTKEPRKSRAIEIKTGHKVRVGQRREGTTVRSAHYKALARLLDSF